MPFKTEPLRTPVRCWPKQIVAGGLLLLTLPVVGSAAQSALPAKPLDPIRVAVVGGFSPVLQSILPSLSQQLKRPIEVTSLPIATLRARLQHPTFDLIITGAPTQLTELDYLDQLHLSSLTVIARSPVLLWCPNPNIRMRVRINDTLKDPNIRSIALSPADSPVGALVRQTLTLPRKLHFKPAAHSLQAWQMAQQGQTDCAFTLIGLVKPTDQYQFVPHRGVKIIAAIPKNSTHPDAAAALLKLMNRPLFRARIQQYGYS